MIQTLILEQYEAMNLGILTQQRQKSKIKRITSSSKCRKESVLTTWFFFCYNQNYSVKDRSEQGGLMDGISDRRYCQIKKAHPCGIK